MTTKRGARPDQPEFDLKELDEFTTSLSVQFQHFKAAPSAEGKVSRGDYRRSQSSDTITSNGMIYRKAGCFSATMVGNRRSKDRSDGGEIDPSVSTLIMPRFYDKSETGDAAGDRIYLAPGDRIYVADPDVDVLVPNYHEMVFSGKDIDIPMFPIEKIEILSDSQGIEYKEGRDFCIDKNGNIKWKSGGKSPGIDPQTKEGRVYSVRYLYRAYWYIVAIPKEVRVTGINEGGLRAASRMPSNAMIQREYVYHNQRASADILARESKDPKRQRATPKLDIKPDESDVVVDMNAIEEG